MAQKPPHDAASLKESVRDYLRENIDRRSFLNRLTALGFTMAAAQNLSTLLASAPSTAAAAPAGTQMQGKGGDILVQQLKQCGVEFVFANPSSHTGAIFDALIDRDDMHVILGLHEGTLAAIADGYGKASGKVPFVIVSRPGFPNTLTHTYNAYKDQTPLIVCADQIDAFARGRAGNQEVEELVQAAEPFTRWRWESRTPGSLAEDVRRAFKFASTFPMGPSFLSIPRDFLQEQVDSEVMDLKHFSQSTQIRPDQGQVEEIADLLIRARSPLLYVGDEVHTLDAESEVVELAELLSVPAVQSPENLRWSNAFPTDHPLYLGEYQGNMRYPAEVDVLLNLGARLRRSETKTPSISRQTQIVQVRMDTVDMGRNYPSAFSHPASVKLFARDLAEAIRSRADRSVIDGWRDQRLEATKTFKGRLRGSLDRVIQQRWSDSPISVERLGMELKAQLPPDACIVEETDSGEAIPGQILTFAKGKMAHLSTSGVGLGWSLGAAVGAQMALPDRQVVALLGDGAFMFGGSQALWNMKRYQVPVLTIVLNNFSYDGERTRIWARDSLQAKLKKDMTCYLGDPAMEFTHLAKAYSVPGERVSQPDDVKAAIGRALDATRRGEPYLLEVITGRSGVGAEDIWYPPYSVVAQRKA